MGRVVEDDINNNNQPWGRKGTLPYTLACTVKSRPRPTSNLTTKREEKGEKDACWLPKLGWLATYVGYVPPCALLSVPGGDIHPTTLLYKRGCFLSYSK